MPRIIYLVTEDWAFCTHRLPMARAAREAGFNVHVVTRVTDHRAVIEAEGFTVHDLQWDRRSIGPWAAGRDVADLIHLYRTLKPDLVHHVAVKPVILGSLAARAAGVPRIVNALVGLGYIFTSQNIQAKLLRGPVSVLLRLVLNNKRTRVIIQNRDDWDNLGKIGLIDHARSRLIRGSGIDIDNYQVLPEPDGPITLGFVARMLDDKGVRPLVAAQQQLQQQGLDIRLLLAGTPDPANPATITEAEMQAFAQLPGITWLGHVTDIQAFWARCHIGVLPSRREGLPKSLMEAAACGRALIATDVPGCREICIDGENGILTPMDDAPALAAAIQMFAQDPARRARYGTASRRMVESDLSAAAIGAATVKLYNELLSANC